MSREGPWGRHWGAAPCIREQIWAGAWRPQGVVRVRSNRHISWMPTLRVPTPPGFLETRKPLLKQATGFWFRVPPFVALWAPHFRPSSTVTTRHLCLSHMLGLALDCDFSFLFQVSFIMQKLSYMLGIRIHFHFCFSNHSSIKF